MISLAERSGADDDWVIDFASIESGKGFLLTIPVLLEADPASCTSLPPSVYLERSRLFGKPGGPLHMETEKNQGGQPGQTKQAQNVPVTVITNTLKGIAKRETSAGDKSHLYEIVEGLGNAIATLQPGFNVQEFVLACGVNPSWATQAA